MVADQVNIGRRRAIERTAHFFMELAERLSVIGFATEIEFKCPLNQFALADALGLSAIHVNRILRQLPDPVAQRAGQLRDESSLEAATPSDLTAHY